jgi:hypothetical protein
MRKFYVDGIDYAMNARGWSDLTGLPEKVCLEIATEYLREPLDGSGSAMKQKYWAGDNHIGDFIDLDTGGE